MTKEEAILCMKDMQDGMSSDKCGDWVEALNMAIVALKQPERKTGKWMIQQVMEYDLAYGSKIYVPEYRCSCCGHYYESYVRGDEPQMPEDADFPDYCESCGCKMEVEQDD